MEIIESLKHMTAEVLHRKKPQSEFSLRRDQHSEFDEQGHTLCAQDVWTLKGEHGAVTLTITPGGSRKVDVHRSYQWCEDSKPCPVTGLWPQRIVASPGWEISVNYPESIQRYLRKFYDMHLKPEVQEPLKAS